MILPAESTEPDRAVIARAAGMLLPVLDELSDALGGDPDRIARLKQDGTPVTSSDTAVDRRLTTAIERAFPDHGVLSEERATTAPATEWTWVLDPVDGTSNLAAGLPYWCVSAALCHRGWPVWGVVDAPATGSRWIAEVGAGSHLDGIPLRTPPPPDPGADTRHVPILMTAGVLRRAQGGLGLNPRVLGSIALDLCRVATGGCAAAIAGRPHVWDVAAGGLVLAEAGGVVVGLGQDPPLLPLRPGVDYARRTAPLAAGPDETWLRQLTADLG